MTKSQPLSISPWPPVQGREPLKPWSIRWLLDRLPSYPRAGGMQWQLGSGFVVWDRSATIEFHKPGRAALHGDSACSEDALAAVRRETHPHGRNERVFHVELRDAPGVVHAAFAKTVVIKRRKPES